MAKTRKLKYSLNPHQKFAEVSMPDDSDLPFEVLNGNPGQINLYDVLHAWPLVRELSIALDGIEAATVYKHTSAAGAAIATPMNVKYKTVCGYKKDWTSNVANAILRAMYGDPKSGFGGVSACSHEIDYEGALAMKPLVLDGIVAPSYSDEALEVLKKKKWDKEKKVGNFLVLEFNQDYQPPDRETRTLYGVKFEYDRNNLKIDRDLIRKGVNGEWIPDEVLEDLIINAHATKYSQSNNITMGSGGQVTGLAAGQQSRVDAVKLAGEKTKMWRLMQHPLIYNLQEGKGSMARVATQQQKIAQLDEEAAENYLHAIPADISLWSDAFFPFRDGPDTALKYDVKYLVAPAGSIRDEEVLAAAEENGQVLVHISDRLFTH